LTEVEIIKGCVQQNKKYQHLLFTQYAGKLFTVCRRYAVDDMEAEDMLQEGFIRIFNNIQKFKFEGSFEGWMRRVVVNVALKHLQKKKIQLTEIKESTTEYFSLSTSAYDDLNEEALLKLIHQLPKGYKIVFNMAVIEGYSHEEIAKFLNIQPSTSRSQLVKARKMLQEQIIKMQKIAV
jgi:RNA polymerase sigma factor (sigma-70 family)